MIIRVDGPAHLYVGEQDCNATGVANATNELGITENGVQISINTLTHRVNSDDMGGAEGNPAELIVMGANATIRGVMVKYNEATAFGVMTSGLYNTTEGSLVLPGTPFFAGNYGFSLKIQGFRQWYYFPKCEMASQPREFNLSTTERKTSFSILAYPIHLSGSSSILYTTGEGGVQTVANCANAYGGSKAHVNTNTQTPLNPDSHD